MCDNRINTDDPIVTEFNLANATPLRQFDWMAYRDPEKPSTYGYGRTEAEALADFNRMELEAACEHECGDGDCQFACTNGGKCPLEKP